MGLRGEGLGGLIEMCVCVCVCVCVSVCVICVIYVGREEERRTGLVEKRKRLSAVLLDCRDALGMVIVLWLYC